MPKIFVQTTRYSAVGAEGAGALAFQYFGRPFTTCNLQLI